MPPEDSREVDRENPDVRFDPFRAPASASAKEAVAEVLKQVLGYEEFRKPRKRSRKARDQDILEETVGAVCADLIHRHLSAPAEWVAVSLSNQFLGRKSRYRAPALGKKLPSVLKIMAAPELAFIEIEKGRRSFYFRDEEGTHRVQGKLTTIRAGTKLISRINRFGLGFADLGRSDNEETIILKSPKSGHNAGGEWMEYEDTADTLRFREEMREINDWLRKADISLEMDDGEEVDIYQRRLRRIFNNGSFSQGGRLWGGFWMNLNKETRRNELSIGGEKVTELDYGQMAIRLLYGLEGATPPEGDLYRIPGNELFRDGVKTIINAALFSETEQTRMPKGARSQIPEPIRYSTVLAAIRHHHQPIAHHFFKGRGMELMLREAEVLVALLLDLKRSGVVALPIHDAIMVPRSEREVAISAMKDVFLEKTGCDALVRIE